MLDVCLAELGYDLAAVEATPRPPWTAGDHAVVGVTPQIVAESLCEALDLRSGQRVLDAGAGNGGCALAAARRFCDVVCAEHADDMLRRGLDRACAERLPIAFQPADARALPFADASFDVVMAAFGVMLTPERERTAAELARVCRSGGKIGLAAWTPDGFMGALFDALGRFAPPAAHGPSPAPWGAREGLGALFAGAGPMTIVERTVSLRYCSADHWISRWRAVYEPVRAVFAALDAREQAALYGEIEALIAAWNVADDGTMVAPCDYLEVVIEKS